MAKKNNNKINTNNNIIIESVKKDVNILDDILAANKTTNKTISDDESDKTITKTISDDESDKPDEIDSVNEPSLKDFIPEKSVVYKSNEVLHEDNFFSGIMLIGFGIIGLLVVIFNYISNRQFLGSVFQGFIMSIVFIAFIVLGLFSRKRAINYKKHIHREKSNKKRIQEYLEENVNEEFFKECDDILLCKEENYLKRFEAIKELVISEFENVDELFVEDIIEEFYSENFDN